jgi:hypothetical protein
LNFFRLARSLPGAKFCQFLFAGSGLCGLAGQSLVSLLVDQPTGKQVSTGQRNQSIGISVITGAFSRLPSTRNIFREINLHAG